MKLEMYSCAEAGVKEKCEINPVSNGKVNLL